MLKFVSKTLFLLHVMAHASHIDCEDITTV